MEEPDRICLGHALGARRTSRDVHAVDEALRIATGEQLLKARCPDQPDAVHAAERILNADPRPVYTFLGDLHPDLGSVGLILSRAWARRAAQGVTRCDSGGLTSGAGGFQFIDATSRATCLRELSTPDGLDMNDWSAAFARELSESYPDGARGYVRGNAPDTTTWRDPRAACIAQATQHDTATAGHTQPSHGLLDRRLWTWEVRLHEPLDPSEIEALVLSHNAHKFLNARFTRDGVALPDHIKVLSGPVGTTSIEHWFSEPRVRDALLGAAEDTA